MGYFSNGGEGAAYQERWCSACAHDHPEHGCPVMLSHVLWNYDECNKPDSILHKMIPISADGLRNERCGFFRRRAAT